MDITWLGHACFKIKGKSATIIVDPFSPDSTGLKLPKDLEADIALSTHNHPDHNNLSAVSKNPIVITGPGEYEKSGVTITGTATFHDEQSGAQRGKNTVYNIFIDGINVVHLGDLGHTLTDEQVSQIENCDILLVPVGSVYTINGEKAAHIVSQLEPKIVIPMHYKIPGLVYDLEGPESFLKAMGAEGISPQPKLSITKDKLPEETTVVLLNKS